MSVEFPEPRANPRLYGQGAAQDALERAIRSERLAHGWLLGGPAGVGKATLAYRFARALLAGPDVGPGLALAEDHPVFRLVAQGAHPDLRVIEPERDPKTGKVKPEIPVDTVRTATASLHITPAMGGYRVIVIDGADQLNRNAANALLKSLEEPPPRSMLILISARPARVVPTLRSRCAKLQLARLPDEVVGKALAEYLPELGAEQRDALARFAHGSIGGALELASGEWLALYRRLMDCLHGEPVDRLALQDLAQDLARHAETRGFSGAVALPQEILGRTIAAATDRLEDPLYAGERDALQDLAGKRPLDRWPGLWDKTGRLAAAVDGLNLDRGQAFLHILTLLALPPDRGDGPCSAPAALRRP
jgi:DNA polymerase III subunit delta'